MFHVELRQFPHQARAFNLGREELDRRILEPWRRGQPVQLQDRSWDPARAKLSVYEGGALGVEDMGLGRGWANVTRSGTDVTEQLLAEGGADPVGPPQVERLKGALLARAAERPLALTDVGALAGELGLSDRAVPGAVWQLLEEGLIALSRPG